MKRHEPCAHLRPDYNRLEVAHHITRDPESYEISWEPCAMEDELRRLGLIADQPCSYSMAKKKLPGATR
jgi:hypothetical protein